MSAAAANRNSPNIRVVQEDDTGGANVAPAPFTVQEVLALPVTVDLMTTARALGISKTVAYHLARTGQYPVPLYRVGARYRCLRSTLLVHLGIADNTVAIEPSPLPREASALR
ncbi:MAG: hypothetical protein QG597_4712 [Actinomycetota bacterium]|nr:hypothetical protein [Actinomycetota bacterium]